MALAPDGKTLATCGYDRLVKLWDVASGKEIRTLRDHSDSVYGISFRPDGKLLASAAADRAVKIWDVATGVRLYSLGDPTDWVYAVAWSPDDQWLVTGSKDETEARRVLGVVKQALPNAEIHILIADGCVVSAERGGRARSGSSPASSSAVSSSSAGTS